MLTYPEYLVQWSNDITNQRDRLGNEIDSIKYQTDLLTNKINIAQNVKDQVEQQYKEHFGKIIMKPLIDELEKIREEAEKIREKEISIEMFDELLNVINQNIYSK